QRRHINGLMIFLKPQKQGILTSHKQTDGSIGRHFTKWRGISYFKVMLTNSGVVVIDKTRNLAGLLMACHLNTLKVRDEITYQKFYGDKESYWFSHSINKYTISLCPWLLRWSRSNFPPYGRLQEKPRQRTNLYI